MEIAEYNKIHLGDRVKTLGTRSYITFTSTDGATIYLKEQNGRTFKYPKHLFLRNAIMDDEYNNIHNRPQKVKVDLKVDLKVEIDAYTELFNDILSYGVPKDKLDELLLAHFTLVNK